MAKRKGHAAEEQKEFELPALKAKAAIYKSANWSGLFASSYTKWGIPQGTKLAPLLFAILVNNQGVEI